MKSYFKFLYSSMKYCAYDQAWVETSASKTYKYNKKLKISFKIEIYTQKYKTNSGNL